MHRFRRAFALAPALVLGALMVACPASEPGQRAGALFQDCPDCPEMVVIGPGSFLMGSPAGEAGRFDDEGPQHTVIFARRFAVGRAPITRAEYELFARDTGRRDAAGCASMNDEGNWTRNPRLSWENPGFAQTSEHPVVCVSWEDARAYAKWLGNKTGRPYRLLTEAEYEYVARAGSTTAFVWGASEKGLCAHANGFDASARKSHPDWPGASCNDGYPNTAPVRAFPVNPFGAYGAVGNVFQWTEDCFVEGGYVGAPTDGTARTVEACGVRVIRGGSWLNGPRGLRSAMRDRDRQRDRYTNIGFRIAREL